MKRLCTLLVPTLSCALVLGCGSPTDAEKDADLVERQAKLVSGDWVSEETYTGSEGTTLNLRVSINPVAARSVLLGTWRLGIRTGSIEDGDLTENDISLLLRVRGLSALSLTGTVSSDAIVGTLTGDVVKSGGGRALGLQRHSVHLTPWVLTTLEASEESTENLTRLRPDPVTRRNLYPKNTLARQP